MSEQRTQPVTLAPMGAMWHEAASYAARLHKGQRRKDGRTPYIAHPFRVAMIVRDVFGCDEPVALTVALLHDVLEDTPADFDDLEERFGAEVAEAVAALTKDMRQPQHVREPSYDEQLREASWQAQLVKLADAYDNIADSLHPRQRYQAIQKGYRAVECCGDGGPLEPAVRALTRLMDQASADLAEHGFDIDAEEAFPPA